MNWNLFVGILFGVMVILNAVFVIGFSVYPFAAVTFILAGVHIISSTVRENT